MGAVKRNRSAPVFLLVAAAAAGLAIARGPAVSAQLPAPPVQTPQPRPVSPASAEAAARAAERIKALQQEADLLVSQERTLLVDLRRLEVARDLKLEQLRQADAQVAEVSRRIAETTDRMRAAQAAIEAARPGLEARMVEAYKLGRPGYARMLLSVDDLRDMARASRAIAAMAQLDERRVSEFAAAVSRLQAASASLGRQSAELKAAQAAARDASLQAARAAAARADLIRQIDERRDLNARMTAELETVRQRLTKTLTGLPTTSADDPTLLPLRPFRGVINWPVAGRLASRFGERRNPRFGTTTLQNGIEVATGDGAAVTAIHEGRVAFAGVFTGFGQLVIIDHGTLAYSLYGYMATVSVIKGARVARGQRIGTTGRAPAGNSALYFELRIDGKPVDPVQWLRRQP